MEKRCILAVDDDLDVVRLIEQVLRGRYNVRTADSASRALEIIEQGFVPDLFILDVMMPQTDGLMLASTLKERTASRQVPIIFLTTKSSARDIVAGINAGAKHYIVKPFSVTDLLAKANKLLA